MVSRQNHHTYTALPPAILYLHVIFHLKKKGDFEAVSLLESESALHFVHCGM